MGAACIKFNTPVTGGNVSFYNQSPDGPVYPTPTIGMVGLLESADQQMTLPFRAAGDAIYLVGRLKECVGSSEYLHKIHGVEFSPCPYFNLEEEFDMQAAVSSLIKQKLIISAHDISEGGLIITLLESAFPMDLGFDVSAAGNTFRTDAYWFGEAQGRVVVSVKAGAEENLKARLDSLSMPYVRLGEVTTGDIRVEGESWGQVEGWKEKYNTSIEKILGNHDSEEALTML
jgi:phosphoribosylformylglycinamidine synthase